MHNKYSILSYEYMQQPGPRQLLRTKPLLEKIIITRSCATISEEYYSFLSRTPLWKQRTFYTIINSAYTFYYVFFCFCQANFPAL